MTRYLVDLEAQANPLDMPPNGTPIKAVGYSIVIMNRGTGTIAGRYIGEHAKLFDALSIANDSFVAGISPYIPPALFDITKIGGVKAPDVPQER